MKYYSILFLFIHFFFLSMTHMTAEKYAIRVGSKWESFILILEGERVDCPRILNVNTYSLDLNKFKSHCKVSQWLFDVQRGNLNKIPSYFISKERDQWKKMFSKEKVREKLIQYGRKKVSNKILYKFDLFDGTYVYEDELADNKIKYQAVTMVKENDGCYLTNSFFSSPAIIALRYSLSNQSLPQKISEFNEREYSLILNLAPEKNKKDVLFCFSVPKKNKEFKEYSEKIYKMLLDYKNESKHDKYWVIDYKPNLDNYSLHKELVSFKSVKILSLFNFRKKIYSICKFTMQDCDKTYLFCFEDNKSKGLELTLNGMSNCLIKTLEAKLAIINKESSLDKNSEHAVGK